MNAKLLFAVAVALTACASAPPPAKPAVAQVSSVDGGTPAPPPPPREPSRGEIPLTLANVVKQVAPEVKLVAVFGRKEAVEELVKAGIRAEYVGSGETKRCVPEVDSKYDVIVSDGVQPHDAWPLTLPILCSTEDVIFVARGHRQLNQIQDERRRPLFIDAKCSEDCDAYRIQAGRPTRWFVTNGLPLTAYDDHLRGKIGDVRSATGVVLGGTSLLIEDDMQVEVPGLVIASDEVVDRELLRGWIPYDALDALPKQVRGLARVNGRVHFDGAIGLHRSSGPWTPPPSAPAMFQPVKVPAALFTMTSPHLDGLLDAATLKAFNARDDAAWREVTARWKAKAPMPAEPLRSVCEELKAWSEFGRYAMARDVLDSLERNDRKGALRAIADHNEFLTHAQEELMVVLLRAGP